MSKTMISQKYTSEQWMDKCIQESKDREAKILKYWNITSLWCASIICVWVGFLCYMFYPLVMKTFFHE